MILSGKPSICTTGARITWNGEECVLWKKEALLTFLRYDPAAITTSKGALQVTLSSKETHGLNYQGGMMSTWNKFCFTGGLLQAAVTLPGANDVVYVYIFIAVIYLSDSAF